MRPKRRRAVMHAPRVVRRATRFAAEHFDQARTAAPRRAYWRREAWRRSSGAGRAALVDRGLAIAVRRRSDSRCSGRAASSSSSAARRRVEASRAAHDAATGAANARVRSSHAREMRLTITSTTDLHAAKAQPRAEQAGLSPSSRGSINERQPVLSARGGRRVPAGKSTPSTRGRKVARSRGGGARGPVPPIPKRRMRSANEQSGKCWRRPRARLRPVEVAKLSMIGWTGVLAESGVRRHRHDHRSAIGRRSARGDPGRR